MLKIDRHKYVKVAYHGFRELTRAERRAVYSDTNVGKAAFYDDHTKSKTLSYNALVASTLKVM